ncbi:MAG TPA: hypothetical protein VFV92_05715 [Candidatus Bathyarchaeia archaeon]|nr:hypothetical protein [Candidatus Bathyarchaeia archaeon]
MISGKISKNDTARRAPAANAKKYLIGSRLFLRVNRPPVRVEKKVMETKAIASSLTRIVSSPLS